jgi:hypothetical protein
MRVAATGNGDRGLSGRAERLQRLVAFRLLTEELDRSALQVALLAVLEVESAITELDKNVTESKMNARAALSEGNRPEWMMADAQKEVAGWNLSKLKSMLMVRVEGARIARERFLESRCEHEQVMQLIKDAHQAALLVEVRREQASADEWFLSKRSQDER